MKKICAVISGGDFSPLTGIELADFVIVCDKGYEYAKKENITPNLFVGDMDSCSIPPKGDILRLDLPTEKDDTDTLAAIRYAIANGFTHINLYCALGGRLDHTLSNIQSGVFAAQNGVKLSIISEQNAVIFLSGETAEIPKKEGCALSVFSATDICENVNLSGVKYPLSKAKIYGSFPIGQSNEWISDFAEISVGSGVLAVVISKK